MHRSLSARLLLYVALPLVVCATAGGALVLKALEGQFERRMQEEVELVARALQRPVSYALERGHEGNLHEAVGSALLIGRVYGASVYDDRGVRIVTSGRASGARPPATARRLGDGDRGAGRYGLVGDEEVYAYFVPVRLDADRIGLLEVTRRREDMARFMARLRAAALGVLTLASTLMGIILLVGYRAAVGAALDGLLASIRRVQAGDLSHRAVPSGPREVRTLVRAFNRMLDSLIAAEKTADAERDDRARLQVRLAESEKLAAVGDLAAGIAHELGTPLSTVEGRVQRVLRRDDMPEAASRELRGLAHETGRMSRLVRQVLAYGRSDRGATRTSCPAGALASMAMRAVSAEAEAADVSVALHQGAQTNAWVYVNLVRSEQALVNLLRNAVQAVASEPTGQVTVSYEEEGGFVVYRVEDDGPGVPPAILPRLFEPFFTTKKHQDGTGLGLGIVRAVAREHGGSVEVCARVPRGTTFSLRLPLAERRKGAEPVSTGRKLDPTAGRTEEEEGG